MATRGGAGRLRRRRGSRRFVWPGWRRGALEAVALVTTVLIVTIALLGELAAALAGTGLWSHLLPFAGAVLALGIAAALLLRAWLALRGRLAGYAARAPAVLAVVVAGVALAVSRRPAFRREMGDLQALVGGSAAAERASIAHQVWATYRRTDTAQMLRILERARVYEATVHEAAAAFAVDPEVLMGVGAAESAFYPRDSADGGRGLFQITAPPAEAVAETRRRLHVEQLDALNQRHNAFLAAATLHLYLDEMSGDLFLALLAYNIGPRNGGLRAAMQQYGAGDFVTVQPYLQNLPRDYPIRVLAAALAYRLWRTEGRLPRYEEGDNASRVQQAGIPGLTS